HDALAARGAGQRVLPEGERLGARQGVHEADRRAAFHAVQQHVGQRLGHGRVRVGAADAESVGHADLRAEVAPVAITTTWARKPQLCSRLARGKAPKYEKPSIAWPVCRSAWFGIASCP